LNNPARGSENPRRAKPGGNQWNRGGASGGKDGGKGVNLVYFP